MNEFIKGATDILTTVLPDSDAGKLLALLIVAWFLLIVTGRFKLKWIGIVVKHIYRWLRCKISDKHYYQLDGIGWTDITAGRSHGTYVCAVCSKVQVFR